MADGMRTGGRGAAGGSRRLLRALPLVPLFLVTALVSAAPAQVAAIAVTPTIGGPTTVTAGQTGVAGSVTFANSSIGVGPVTLTSITYHPSCASTDLACSAPEVGVFSLGPVAVGAAGTACGDRVFLLAADGQGRYTFSANPAIVLTSSAACTINFTFDVLRVPTTDAQPAFPGVQTTRSALVTGTATANGGGTVTGTSRASSSITVLPVQPAIVTQVTAPQVTLGSPVSDTATVTGAPNVPVTGTVTFNLYGANDPTCALSPLFTSTVVMAGNTANSGSFVPGTPGTYRWKATYNGNANNLPVTGACNAPNESVEVLPAGRYVPLTPARILDTRIGTGGIAGPIGPDATVSVQITGRGGVPASGVSAVAMNVTVTQPSARGYLTIYPTGTARPLAANLNFTPNKTVPNLVVVKLGTDGKVDMYNAAGSTYVVADVAGYFTATASGTDGRFQPLTPARIVDTRTGAGAPAVRLGPGASLDLQITGQGGVPVVGAQAVVMNVAVTNTTAASYLTVHPTGEARPLAANLNWLSGETVGNRVIAKLGVNGRVTIYNPAGETDVIVDVNGWFTNGNQAQAGSVYAPLVPARILDTRIGTGGISGARPAGSTVDIQVTGVGGVPTSGVSAVILNATVVNPVGPGFLTMFPAGTARPLVSDLNYATGEIRPNLVVVKVGAGGKVSLYTPTTVDVVFDVAGFFP
jgi:hypothetical protein